MLKRRSREISIFNLSMLDVFASAMAAFLIIMIILLPYYERDAIADQSRIAELQQALDATQAELASAEAAREAAEAETQSARAEAERQRQQAESLVSRLARTFLVLYIRWNTLDDIDLHVIDPSGAEFYFEHKTRPGRPGELSEDTINGPGNEVWEVRDAPPGRYQIFAQLYKDKDARKPAVVQGRVFHRDGSNAFPTVRLNRTSESALITTIQVDADGNVMLR
ncbi:YfaP family protein [Thiorhodovibrio frisius]|uniref:DUF2135 domain-containing protein n=1 Tax=Thiorhodovibrio frisius TaxID=631362 RepID=H8YXL4_9GAMM|nr:hypothetical protein [Thiorhodovibrio frisius]EIC23190.1 hypothetical protein Thi970DRAFT_00845 [Thiorhodovibrio frisius]WPL22538.1 Membrane-bound metallopeptidase [Thiorhodovibrio frisius]